MFLAWILRVCVKQTLHKSPKMIEKHLHKRFNRLRHTLKRQSAVIKVELKTMVTGCIYLDLGISFQEIMIGVITR